MGRAGGYTFVVPTTLLSQIKPCGPVADPAAAERVRKDLAGQPWLESAWPALAPVAGASSYLGGLMRRYPEMLSRVLEAPPETSLERLLKAAEAVEAAGEGDEARSALRQAKNELHLMTALADLGGIWGLDAVTGALARFADATTRAALAVAAREAQEAGKMLAPPDLRAGPVPGYFVLALGKHGAFELNYSSDIDITVFYDPSSLPVAEGVEPQALALRITQTMAAILQERTADGYVFRVDLRLRPDPSSTPAAVPVEAALEYYETVGQNWERAAMIKARVCAGDIQEGEAFLKELLPFIWRRTLDYAAIADIHSIKRQIHTYKVDDRLTAKGANLKLGRGGIREVEFYVQTQQLILGGRDPSLRSFRTLDALKALTETGHIEPAAARDMAQAYEHLRAWEHRVQMVADEQTHTLPENDNARKKVATLSGFANVRSFDAAVNKVLRTVNKRYGELFPEEEALSSRFGSLVFTGVDDDPETLATLARMGFSNPEQVAATIRSWHHGRIPATRTARGRELFTRLAPRLLDAAYAAGAPDAAFNRFGDFFAGLSSGVQIQSLFLAEPKLLDLVVSVLAYAPQLAHTLARRPATLDSLVDPGFFAPIDETEMAEQVTDAVARADGFEAAMDAARRVHREQAFRIGVQVMSATAGPTEAGRAFAALADACLGALAQIALKETVRIGGGFDGEVAVVALGKAGSREMTAGSDLDLMTVFRSSAPDAMSEIKFWDGGTFYARFTQRLITALSAPTGEGDLYEVDMRLRPSGAAGPVAVSLKAFEGYYESEAETWEFLALTRARVAWATSPAFADVVNGAILEALRRPRDGKKAGKDAREMRKLLAKEKPPSSFWDVKLVEGGLVDVEFAAQFLQIVHAAEGGPLVTATLASLRAMQEAGLAPATVIEPLMEAFETQQAISQVMKLALADADDPAKEPPRLKALLARAGGAKSFATLTAKLKQTRANAHKAFLAALSCRD